MTDEEIRCAYAARAADCTAVLGPQGRLLIGFFDGAPAEPFEHAITEAYSWSVHQMSRMVWDAGFDVLDVETRQDPGRRPHAAISAMSSQR